MCGFIIFWFYYFLYTYPLFHFTQLSVGQSVHSHKYFKVYFLAASASGLFNNNKIIVLAPAPATSQAQVQVHQTHGYPSLMPGLKVSIYLLICKMRKLRLSEIVYLAQSHAVSGQDKAQSKEELNPELFDFKSMQAYLISSYFAVVVFLLLLLFLTNCSVCGNRASSQAIRASFQ